MFGMGDAGYDRTIMYSPDGRIIQVEYAKEAVRRGSSVIAIKGETGIAILAESRSFSKLVEPNEKVSQLDDDLFVAFSGLLADSRVLINESRVYAQIYKITYGGACDVETLAWHLSNIAQHITQFGGRPFGLSLIIAGLNDSTPTLSVIEPSGAKYDANAIAIGKNDDELMKYLEEHYKPNMTLAECQTLVETAFEKTNQDKRNYELIIMDFKNHKIERNLVTPN
jgi:20S proteasome alpha/beta subunit